jgi:UDP-N-acetylmuramoylalanine--D-glutamate ligase
MAALLAITDLEQFDFIKSVRDMQNFTSVEHRLEYVCDVNGKVFYNDSKATNPVSAIKSLEAFEQSIAIVGGKNKGLDLAEFLQIASQKCAHIIAIGELQQPIYDYLKNSLNYETVETAATLAQAVELANAKSESLPVVLAPASSSFDMFNSYEDRGKQFKELVGKL